MAWGLTAVAGATLVGGLMSSNAASSAADTQSQAATAAAQAQLQATNNSNALTAAMYQQGQANQSPYLEGGQTALSALMSGLGLGPAQAYQPQTTSSGTGTYNPAGGGVNPNVPTVQGNGRGLTGMTSANSLSPIGGPGLVGNGASGPASGVQLSNGAIGHAVAPPPGATAGGTGTTTAPAQVTDPQGNPVTANPYGIGNTNYGATQAQLNAGAGAVTPGSLSKNFSAADLMAGIDPGYAFRMQQGNANLQARQAASGNRFGGQALKDISDYNQSAASQEYGNAYNRYVTNQTNLFNRLSSLAGTGQTAANNGATAGANAASSIGSNTIAGTTAANNYLTGAAAANAAGTVGSTNAIVGGINNAANNWYTGQLLSKYAPQTTPAPGSPGSTLY